MAYNHILNEHHVCGESLLSLLLFYSRQQPIPLHHHIQPVSPFTSDITRYSIWYLALLNPYTNACTRKTKPTLTPFTRPPPYHPPSTNDAPQNILQRYIVDLTSDDGQQETDVVVVDVSEPEAEANRPLTGWRRCREKHTQHQQGQRLQQDIGSTRGKKEAACSDLSDMRQREQVAVEAAARAAKTASTSFRVAVCTRGLHTAIVKEADIARDSVLEENLVAVERLNEMRYRKAAMTRCDAWSDHANAAFDCAQNKLDFEEIPKRNRAEQNFQQSKAWYNLRMEKSPHDVSNSSKGNAEYEEYLVMAKRVEMARDARNAKFDVCSLAISEYLKASAIFKTAAAKHRRALDNLKAAREDQLRADAEEKVAARKTTEAMLEARRLRGRAKRLGQELQLLRSKGR